MRSLGILLMGAALLAAPQGAGAPAPRTKGLTREAAKLVAAAAALEAGRQGAGGAVAVVDGGGHLLAFERLDGTFAAAARISVGKARTAALFGKPTRVFEEIIAKGRTAMAALDDFTPLQGGLPIVVDGVTVGGIGVSGAASAAADEVVAEAGLAALAESPKPVLHIDGGTVAEAFAKGAVLVNDGAGFMVHASRRDAPGQAEVHDHETDVIHVLEGEATFVTGGEVVDGVATAPGEVRGTSIRGGTARQIARGDVLVVPKGTPHWFQRVRGPLLYYVVKVG